MVEGDGRSWFGVGCSKASTPAIEDIGCVLRLKCDVVDNSENSLAPTNIMLTGHVIGFSLPHPRHMIPIGLFEGCDHIHLGALPSNDGIFSLLSYNIMADIYPYTKYSYCPKWALRWQYCRQNLLHEIAGYEADILCFQEVQADHLENFFAPELEKHGYTVVYKKKSNEVYADGQYKIDGCATFFRRDRFKEIKTYKVEYNKPVKAMAEQLQQSKDNVALVVVLELKENALVSNTLHSIHGQCICVANTHIHADPTFADVKLWQVASLLRGLRKFSSIKNIPILVCADLNSLPGSAAYNLVVMGKVDPNHPDLAVDPIGMFQNQEHLNSLTLKSVYSSLLRARRADAGVEHQQKLMNPITNEPLFTNFTEKFSGTIDYIFYTADKLMVDGLLELLDEESLRKETALPSPDWSSDHIALMARFRIRGNFRECDSPPPLANLSAEGFSSILSEHAFGVYFGRAGLSTRGIYKMAMSIGRNPYFNNTEKTIEPWLLHKFDEDFCGEELRLAIVGYIRPEADFPSLESLIAKIHDDGKIGEKALDLPLYVGYKGCPYLKSTCSRTDINHEYKLVIPEK